MVKTAGLSPERQQLAIQRDRCAKQLAGRRKSVARMNADIAQHGPVGTIEQQRDHELSMIALDAQRLADLDRAIAVEKEKEHA